MSGHDRGEPSWRVSSHGIPRRTLVRGLGLLSGVALLEAAAGCATARPATQSVGAAISGAEAAAPEAASATAERVERIGAVLRRRAQAYAEQDRAAWIAAVGAGPARSERQPNGADEASAREDGAAFDVMRALGVADLAYGQARIEGAYVMCPLTYRLAGIDGAAAEGVTRWDLGAWPPRRAEAPVFPWEEPGAWAVRDAAAVVAGGAPRALLAQALILAGEAAAAVRRVWGGAAPRPAVVLPATRATFARWAAQDGDTTQVPAVTVGPVRNGAATGCDRIVVNPQVWPDLVAEGRRVVLTHEATHLVLRRDADQPRPMWLEEGFCEYVAYAASSLPEATQLVALTRQIRREGPPEQMPTAAAFTGTEPAVGYAAGLLACRVIAERSGVSGMLRFVRAACGDSAGDATVAEPLRLATGWEVADLEQAWRSRAVQLAARA